MFGLKIRLKDMIYMVIAGVFVFIVVAIVNYGTKEKIVFDEKHPQAQQSLKPIDGDFTIGNANAPIQVVFYGDYTCHHCIRFISKNFEKLRDNYIINSKILFIFRPVISLKRSLYGSKFLFCDKRPDGENADIFFNMFENKWMMKEDYLNALMKLAVKRNWSTKEHFLNCINSKEVEKNLHRMYETTIKKLNIHETPHIFINQRPATADESIFAMLDREYRLLQKK